MLTDDQGYGDLSCHGNPILKTPNLDKLYAESTRFTDFHVAPMCTPTRGELLTGKQAFMKAMQIDEAGLAIMSNEFEKYQKWVLRKIMLRHVKAGRLIPATEWRNSRGKSSGLREDDRLASPGKPAE